MKEASDRLRIREGALRAIDIGKGWWSADADLGQFPHGHETRPRLPMPIRPAPDAAGSGTPDPGAAV